MNDASPRAGTLSHGTEALKLYFQHLFANSRDMMNLFSLSERKIIMLNQAAEHVTGYSLEELTKLPVELLYPADEFPKLSLAFARLRDVGYSSEKLRMYVRTGELRDIWTRSYVVQYEPEVVCLVHTMDITEENRKQERELRNARLATLGESSATLAHELLNPLQSMQFNLLFLRQQLVAPDVTKVETALARLERAVAHMNDVISSIQKFARNARSGGAYVSLPSIVNDALQIMHGYAETKGVTISTAFQHPLSPVWAERAHVEQILIILIKNAVQAMSSREERRLRISAAEVDGRVRVELTDTGGGLRSDIEARIFEPFATTKPVGVGVGLGLSTAKQLALNNGIGLTCTTETGVGTTFTLEFAISGEQHASTTRATVTGRNLLLVGDDPELLDTVSNALMNVGARVLVATSVPDAIQRLLVHSIDAVLCDQSMYPIDVRTFITKARQVFDGPLGLIAEAQTGAPLDDPELRISCVLRKPLDANAIVQAVAGLVT